MPTPTIIEAAQALYLGHNVEDISRNDASAKNLNQTTKAINKIIDYSKAHNRKSICFITGVPGAGKTLAGLNIAVERQKIAEDEHAVFLSGNGPLVDVLQEALARDDAKRNHISRKEASRKVKEFHHFRDDAISVDTPPVEKVAIFDEAQRAWDEQNLTDFMKKKKHIEDLHLAVSLRSFRSENVSNFVKALLDVDIDTAKRLYEQFNNDYPVFVNRNLHKAKLWVRSQAKGTQRYRLTASSGAKRLRKYGIWVQNKIEATNWFLNGKNDVRSSFHLEKTATEFDIQGLELDWTIVCWDADLRFENGDFKHLKFVGTKWQNIKSADKYPLFKKRL